MWCSVLRRCNALKLDTCSEMSYGKDPDMSEQLDWNAIQTCLSNWIEMPSRHVWAIGLKCHPDMSEQLDWNAIQTCLSNWIEMPSRHVWAIGMKCHPDMSEQLDWNAILTCLSNWIEMPSRHVWAIGLKCHPDMSEQLEWNAIQTCLSNWIERPSSHVWAIGLKGHPDTSGQQASCFSYYCKIPEKFGHPKICCNHPKSWSRWLYLRVMGANNAEGIANSIDPDQTALGVVWSGSALFAQACLSENLGSLRYHSKVSHLCISFSSVTKTTRSACWKLCTSFQAPIGDN